MKQYTSQWYCYFQMDIVTSKTLCLLGYHSIKDGPETSEPGPDTGTPAANAMLAFHPILRGKEMGTLRNKLSS